MLTITSDSISPSQRPLIKHIQIIAPAAANLVTNTFGPLPSVQLFAVGDVDRWAALTADVELAVVPEVSDKIRAMHRRHTRRGRRGRYGITVLAADGVAILINLRKASSTQAINATVVHELVHAHQLGSTQTRTQEIAYLRHCWDVEHLPRRDVRQHERVISRREDDAYGAEHLASHLPA